MPFSIIVSTPTTCSGVVRNDRLTVTALGQLSLGCPVKRVIKAKGVVFAWDNVCQAPGRFLSVGTDIVVKTENGAVFLESNEQFDGYFGIVTLTYETAGGLFVYLAKDNSANGYDTLLPNNTDRYAVLRLNYPGGCEYVTVLLPEDVPIVNSHAEAGCCPCVSDTSTDTSTDYGTYYS